MSHAPAGGASRQAAGQPLPAGEPSALQALLPHILATFRGEPALALTVAYLLVALAGIFYNYAFFERGFGIPVLTLSQVGDFLVAGLQQPVALALMLSTFPLCWLFDLINARSRRRLLARLAALRAKPELSRWQAWRLRFGDWHLGAVWVLQLSYVVVVLVYGWLFVGWYAGVRADAVRRGDAGHVTVRLNGDPADLPATGSGQWAYLGAVANYVFVYDTAGHRSLVIPVNAISRITPLPARTAPQSTAVLVPRP